MAVVMAVAPGAYAVAACQAQAMAASRAVEVYLVAALAVATIVHEVSREVAAGTTVVPRGIARTIAAAACQEVVRAVPRRRHIAASPGARTGVHTRAAFQAPVAIGHTALIQRRIVRVVASTRMAVVVAVVVSAMLMTPPRT